MTLYIVIYVLKWYEILVLSSVHSFKIHESSLIFDFYQINKKSNSLNTLVTKSFRLILTYFLSIWCNDSTNWCIIFHIHSFVSCHNLRVIVIPLFGLKLKIVSNGNRLKPISEFLFNRISQQWVSPLINFH